MGTALVGPVHLLDREYEIASEQELLDRADAGMGGVLFVEGDAGIGKTSLVRAATALASDRGMRVLTARGAELELDLAFGVVRHLFGGIALPDTSAAALAAPVLGATAIRTEAGGGPELFSALHGLYWVTADLGAERPVLLVVDDAHWCDLPSLRFLAYLARRVDGLPVALLVAARPVTTGPRHDLLDALTREPGATVLHPGPLPARAIGAWVTSALGQPADEGFSDACLAATRGNPFLLTELLAELRAAGVPPRNDQVDRLRSLVPRGVQKAVLTRLNRLPAGVTALAMAAAVLGDGADVRRAARLVDLPEERAGALADALVAARLLEPQTALTFVHPLLRAAVTSTTGPAELAELHRRAATMLAADGECGDVLVPHLLAAEATDDPWVVAELREAAVRAAARGAPETAARYLSRALTESPEPALRPQLLLELGIAEMHAGLPDARSHLSAAAEQAGESAVRARAGLGLARALFLCGELAESVRVGQRAIEDLGGRDPDLDLELRVELVGAARQVIAHRPLALRLLARHEDIQPRSTSECMLLANLAVEEAAVLGCRDRTIDLAERALCAGRLFEPRAMVTLPLALYGLTLAGRARQSLQLWDEAIAHHRRRGQVQGFAIASAFRGYTAHQLGDVESAVTDSRMALELARTHDMTFIEPHAAAWLVAALIDAGDLTAADAEIAVQQEHIGGREEFVSTRLLSSRGQLRIAQGRPDEAIADLRACGDGLAEWGVRNPWLCPWISQLALALWAAGRRSEAVPVAAEAVALARTWQAPFALAESLRTAGLIAGGAEGVEQLREAVAVAATGESELEHARALAALGGVLRRVGARRSAREPLREALDRAVRSGAHALVGDIRGELIASGAQPRRLRTTGCEALTPAERRVVRMAADGGTNRAIAQALFVSEKTVETHLAHSYRKLGVTARSQLPDALDGAAERTA